MSMSEIICNLFAARDTAHELHLKTRSFAAHMALDGLYNGLVPLIDALAETIQGKYGVFDMSKCQPMTFDKSTPVEFVKQFASWAEEQRGSFDANDTHLLNDWDVIITLIYTAKYKLENLG